MTTDIHYDLGPGEGSVCWKQYYGRKVFMCFRDYYRLCELLVAEREVKRLRKENERLRKWAESLERQVQWHVNDKRF